MSNITSEMIEDLEHFIIIIIIILFCPNYHSEKNKNKKYIQL